MEKSQTVPYSSCDRVSSTAVRSCGQHTQPALNELLDCVAHLAGGSRTTVGGMFGCGWVVY